MPRTTDTELNEEATPRDGVAFEPNVSDLLRFCVDDLKIIAAKACIDIFNDYDETEIARTAVSTQEAWRIGKAIRKKGECGSR